MAQRRRRRRPQATSQTSDEFPQPVRSPDKDCLEHFERFCSKLILPDVMTPFRLEDWQRDPLRDYFEHGAMEHLWLWPTGMGKSTLLGALALHHGTYVRLNPRVVILGGLGNHGRHTLRAAAWFISQNATLRRWWVAQEYGMGRIKSRIIEDADGVIEVSSAGRRVGGRGGSSQEGETPSLVLVEELHRHEDNGGAVRTLTTKVQKRTVGRHRVRIVHVTTAGDSMDSPLGRMVKKATGNGSRQTHPHGPYNLRSEDLDGDIVMHQWAVPEHIQPPQDDEDRAALDEYVRQVKKANPATFITEHNLRRIWKASLAEPWVFLRQNCNQWVTQDYAAISNYGWAQGKQDDLEIPAFVSPVFVGLDTATSFDTTAIIPVWIEPTTQRPRTAGGVILRSRERGTRRRMRNVIDVLQVMRQRWPDMKIVFDRNKGGGLIAEQFEEDYGMTVIDHDQGVPMEVASMLLGETVDQAGFDHDGSEAVTAQVLAAVAKPVAFGRRWRLAQPRSKEPVDGCTALAMAYHMAKVWEPPFEVSSEDFRIDRI